jgi:ribosomal protein S18 acetylase RimI-like enzyme
VVSEKLEAGAGLNQACYVQPHFITRDGRADDVGSCISLALIASPSSDVSIWRTSLLEDVESPDHLLVVAERADDVIGYGRVLRFVPSPDAPHDIAPSGYYLMGLVVHPDHRRRGVATALIRARLDWISQHADDAWYFANALNTASIALHAPFGFKEVTRSFFYPRVDFDRGQGVLFRLTFPKA